MSTPVMPPTDNPPAGCSEHEFALWQAAFRKRRSAELVSEGVNAQRIKLMVDLEVEAARRRSRSLESGVLRGSR